MHAGVSSCTNILHRGLKFFTTIARSAVYASTVSISASGVSRSQTTKHATAESAAIRYRSDSFMTVPLMYFTRFCRNGEHSIAVMFSSGSSGAHTTTQNGGLPPFSCTIVRSGWNSSPKMLRSVTQSIWPMMST